MKISEIEKILKETPLEVLAEAISQFDADERAGVKKLCARYTSKLEKHQLEVALWEQKVAFDEVFAGESQYLVGVDEVGRGPLAGPVVAAAVILPKDVSLVGLKDSKKLSEAQRESLYDKIKEVAIAYGVGIVPAEIIDEIYILQATFLAMQQALEDLNYPYDVIGVDGDKIIPHIDCPQHAIIKGDDKSAAIAASSVIAKVTRDRMMKTYHESYPDYDWESNKGYGSSKHYEGIEKVGLTPLHRRSFLKGLV